ncbi:hypothetical protein [Mesobacillus subterraneus]|uniref:Uncharacterized protein n=1 Tax=Mesobacillus subterraneus TaxID=285983 RepID=A0A427TNL7_9BACI|nr:hypothetical protein [Mesobacillus subterraneus]RSD25906.1 hypothetical protein EJA10_16100 [Mesobacillus subterraneus]
MNSHLMEILSREIVKSLPLAQKEIYEYIVELEDELAQEAETADEFLALLVKHSPHRKAAKQFNLTFGQLVMTMHEIENIINSQMEQKLRNITWIDFTDQVEDTKDKKGDTLYFYFSLNEVHSCFFLIYKS